MTGIQRITIDQQLAEIGVKVTPAQMHITTPRMEMEITSDDAEFEVESRGPTFKINRKKINEESGLLRPLTLSRDIAGTAKRKAMGGTAESVQDGDHLKKTELPGNRVAQLSKQKTLRSSTPKDVNIGLMPKSSPEIEWDPGYVHINWSGHKIKIEFQGEYMPNMVIDPPYSVEVFLRTPPYFRITVEEAPDPYMAGQVVDERL